MFEWSRKDLTFLNIIFSVRVLVQKLKPIFEGFFGLVGKELW